MFFFAKMPLSSLSLSCIKDPTEFQDNFFSLEIGSSTDIVSIDCLKSLLGPQQPPQRGRPPRPCPQSKTPVLSSVPAPGPVLSTEPALVRWNPVRLTGEVLSTFITLLSPNPSSFLL